MKQLFKSPRAVAFKCEGPLGFCMQEFTQHLVDGGYCRWSCRRQLQLASEFSKWLHQRDVAIRNLTPAHADRFLRHRARSKKPRRGDSAVLRRVYDLLRQKGVIAHLPEAPEPTPVERVVNEFSSYLQQERRLAQSSVAHYSEFIRAWLVDRFGRGQVDLTSLSVTDIIVYIRRRAMSMACKSARVMATAIRSFLQYARYQGFVQRDISGGIPSISDRTRTSVPKGLSAAQVQRVLACCDRKTRIGLRDYAILLLLARLGLRAREVAFLRLDDFDWRGGRLTVRTKGDHANQFPIPSDVGKAIVGYLKKGRPHSTSRQIFLRGPAPATGFKDHRCVGAVVRRALERARIDCPCKGAHQFRHTLANQMLRRGASLEEIGEVLGHQHPQTTTIYAKVDMTSLKTLAMSWPGGRNENLA